MAHDGNVVRLPLITAYLAKQNELTAVERFSREHDSLSPQLRVYEDLIPLSLPKSGEQFAFQVDLDRCTSCKACVTACHSLNGLDEEETWRFVGTLHGGTTEQPFQQTVTAACHHCVDPACLKGCPVEAYVKDPVTGIVKHLDDQCIGCQYCTLTCPYEVPQYSVKMGIVRKCDMCSGRLQDGEAPACVQACPNEAIAITIVSQREAVEKAQAAWLVPGAPPSAITVPTTTYRSDKVAPSNTLPVDYHVVRPAHAHAPLAVMLVLTQLWAGVFALDALATALLSIDVLAAVRPLWVLLGFGIGQIGMAAALLHLGRPLYAFRAFLGLRTSWMSREIIVLGAFAALSGLYVTLVWRQPLMAAASALLGPIVPHVLVPEALAGRLELAVGASSALLGLLGVFCSVMIYHVTRRRLWRVGSGAIKFYGSAATLGAATLLVAVTAGTWLAGAALPGPSLIGTPVVALVAALITACSALAKFGFELSLLRYRHDDAEPELQRSALLLVRQLEPLLWTRAFATLLGGLLLPLASLALLAHDLSGVASVCAGVGLVTLAAGELLERLFFFAGASAPRMPGTIS